MGQYEKALSYLDAALNIAKEIGDRRVGGNSLINIGNVYTKLGQYEKALSYYESALTIHKEIGNRSGEGDALTCIGYIYGNLGQNKMALLYSETALSIHKEIGDRHGEGGNLTNIGLIYKDMGQYEKAKTALSESIKICEEVGAPESIWKVQTGLARLEAKLEQNKEAVTHYEQALDTIEHMREGLTDKEAKSSFMQDKLFAYDEFIELLSALHPRFPEQGYDRKAVETFERKQGRIFLEEMGQSGARNFAGIPDSVLQQETELSGRLGALQAIRVKEGSKPEKDRDMKRIREIEQQMEAVKAEEQKFQENLKKQHPDYYALKYPKPVSLKELRENVLQSGEMMLIYNVMEEKTCLWAVGKSHFSFHTLNIGEKEMTEKVEQFRNRFIGQGRELRGKVIHADEKADEIPDLHALLFPEPVRKAVSEAKLLYIVPTGALYLLPFEAVPTDPKAEKPHYVIEDHTIAYLSSASLLKTLRESQSRKKESAKYPLLAFADPVYGTDKSGCVKVRGESVAELRRGAVLDQAGGELCELPETGDEAKAIKDILKAPDSTNPLQLRQNASRSNVFRFHAEQKLDDYQYLVFACHGILPGKVTRIAQPSLVLSDPDPDPQSTEGGFLTMADVFGLRLNADLVTLSACNTGRGKEQKGEGIMGLTRAFMYAGTPAISVTLWSVESYSAKDLNVGLFRNLKQGKSPAQALRDIKLSMLRGEIRSTTGDDWRKPRYWAPVVVFGAQNLSDQAVASAGAESAEEPDQPVKSAQTETVTDSNQQVKTGKAESVPEPAPEPVNPAITHKAGAASCFVSTAIGEE